MKLRPSTAALVPTRTVSLGPPMPGRGFVGEFPTNVAQNTVFRVIQGLSLNKPEGAVEGDFTLGERILTPPILAILTSLVHYYEEPAEFGQPRKVAVTTAEVEANGGTTAIGMPNSWKPVLCLQALFAEETAKAPAKRGRPRKSPPAQPDGVLEIEGRAYSEGIWWVRGWLYKFAAKPILAVLKPYLDEQEDWGEVLWRIKPHSEPNQRGGTTPMARLEAIGSLTPGDLAKVRKIYPSG